MTQTIIDKRKELQALSKAAAMLVQTGAADSINEGLALYYKSLGHCELNSFKKWLEKGFVVRKGEKALLLWGQPLKGKNKEAPPEPKPEGPDEYEFFPLAFVFSNMQVQPLDKND